jgi:hypothetical protein
LEGWISPIGDFPLWIARQKESLRKTLRELGNQPNDFQSPRWYTEELLRKATWIEARIAAGDIFKAMGFAMEFGFLSCEMFMKFPNDPKIQELERLQTSDFERTKKSIQTIQKKTEARRSEWEPLVRRKIEQHKLSLGSVRGAERNIREACTEGERLILPGETTLRTFLSENRIRRGTFWRLVNT